MKKRSVIKDRIAEIAHGFGYTVIPNWQLFWVADALETDKAVPGLWSYVGKAFAYCLCYAAASLAVALMLFEDRELG